MANASWLMPPRECLSETILYKVMKGLPHLIKHKERRIRIWLYSRAFFVLKLSWKPAGQLNGISWIIYWHIMGHLLGSAGLCTGMPAFQHSSPLIPVSLNLSKMLVPRVSQSTCCIQISVLKCAWENWSKPRIQGNLEDEPSFKMVTRNTKTSSIDPVSCPPSSFGKQHVGNISQHLLKTTSLKH